MCEGLFTLTADPVIGSDVEMCDKSCSNQIWSQLRKSARVLQSSPCCFVRVTVAHLKEIDDENWMTIVDNNCQSRLLVDQLPK